MNSETFGITFQYSICKHFNLSNNISVNRIDKKILKSLNNSEIIERIFKDKPKPIEYLTDSKKFTSSNIKKCPHNFLLENEETISFKTFMGKGKMFAPKVIGQSSWEVFNHFFGHIANDVINRDNFKLFCLKNIDEILPIIIDYALVSDYNCWLFKQNDVFKCISIKRDNLPDLSFDRKKFSFTNNRKTYSIDSIKKIDNWNEESNSIKYIDKHILEIQIHKDRQYKIRLNRDNFFELLKQEKKINNSMLGDTAELAICKVFKLDPGNDNDRLINNSDKTILANLVSHYTKNKFELYPLRPVKYAGTEKRERGGQSKSGVDFYLEKNRTLSVKTNKSKSLKVCPPEIGQPSPKIFDLYFSKKGWYEGKINEEKFKKLVMDRNICSLLLNEYVKFLNECDYILWTVYFNDNNIISKIINKSSLENINFDPRNIYYYSKDFSKKGSLTIHYPEGYSLGEFQVHSARNSLKFRFNFGNLLRLIK